MPKRQNIKGMGRGGKVNRNMMAQTMGMMAAFLMGRGGRGRGMGRGGRGRRGGRGGRTE